MLEEDKDQNELESEEEEDDEGREFKTIPIAEAVKLQRAERDRRNKEFHEKLDKLKEKTARLKKEYEEKYKKK
ncbi:hypothetical protein PDN14_26905 [Bacillus cereus group sp. Bc222]|uniref:hypothetical protein n=1 Tax=unclassified Bacillus cereus group TaxID=2750818 RepID=UPI001F583DFC|nr:MULTISPECIES: hypothetical protein [unclassified Bacillus cereus group]MDA2242004.1 hypothetical protein [Bacillus cereus group sp. Bc222]